LPLVYTKENPFLKAWPRRWQQYYQGLGQGDWLLPGVWQERWAYSVAIFIVVAVFCF
jgi:hypothetical protein